MRILNEEIFDTLEHGNNKCIECGTRCFDDEVSTKMVEHCGDLYCTDCDAKYKEGE